MECDVQTNTEVTADSDASNGLATYASVMSQGFNVQMRPQLGHQLGRYILTNIPVNRAYFIRATAPNGYLFTSGICSDEATMIGSRWECPWDSSGNALVYGGTTNLGNSSFIYEAEGESALGIKIGRSTKCVMVNRAGIPDGPLDLGFMRIGDSKEASTNVTLVLDFENGTNPRRSLKELKARILRGVHTGDTTILEDTTGIHPVTGHSIRTVRYLLGEEDKAAIGTVTAEVLAGTLDVLLKERDVELDLVEPKEVILSSTTTEDNTGASVIGDSNGESTSTEQLVINLEITGHYSPPPDIDFDYIVQDSINRDTDTIRRGLRDYNQNCRTQTVMVKDKGLGVEDFNEIHSTSGVKRPWSGGRGKGNWNAAVEVSVFRTACVEGKGLPSYFETSLKEIEVRKEMEVSSARLTDSVIYVESDSKTLESWALGPVASLSGLIALLMAAFVFRRAVGERRRTEWYKIGNKTKNTGKETFNVRSMDNDKGSLESALYSADHEEEMTEKEKKMKRKRKEKMIRNKSIIMKKKNDAKAMKGYRDEKKSGCRDGTAKKLAVSQGSDDTISVGKSSENSDDLQERRRSRKKKSSSKRSFSVENVNRKKPYSRRDSDRKHLLETYQSQNRPHHRQSEICKSGGSAGIVSCSN